MEMVCFCGDPILNKILSNYTQALVISILWIANPLLFSMHIPSWFQMYRAAHCS